MTSRKPEGRPCWSYHGSKGPDRWARLHPGWAACAEGREQSPIVLPGRATASADERFTLDYRVATGRLSDRTHTVQVDLSSGCRLVLGDQAFSLKQFHFHIPSEHWWSDAAEAGELHLVHVADSGEVAILGVALRPDAAQTLPGSLWDWLQAAGTGGALTLDPAELVPGQSRFLAYRGSLTTPPCTEGVHWLLAMEPMAVGSGERHWLERRMGRNARPVQPLGSRAVHALSREGS